MVTHDDYLILEKQGLTKKEIAKKLEISVPTLYKRLEVWNKGASIKKAQASQEPQEQKEKPSESESKQEDKSGELVALIATLKAEKASHEEKVKELENQLIECDHRIEKLEDKCNDFMEEAAIANHLADQAKKELKETEDNLQELLGTNENLHKEILIMNDSVIRSTELLNGASDEIEKLTKKYEELKREVEPLRQLALMKLQQDVGA